MSGTTMTAGNGTEGRTRPFRAIDAVGLLCVVAALVLVSGIRIARAEEPLMSVDPVLVEAAEAARANAPAAPAPGANPAQPTIVHLNTRGFNYRMAEEAEADPAALLRFEARTPPAAERGR